MSVPVITSILPTALQAESSLLVEIGHAFKERQPDFAKIGQLLAICQTCPQALRKSIRQEIDRVENEKCAETPHSYRSILEQLISVRHFETAISLIKLNGASIHQPNPEYPYTSTGMTPLHLAAQEGSLAVVEALIEAGVPVDPIAISLSAKASQFPQDPCYWTTPLSCCLDGLIRSPSPQNYVQVLDYLLSRGAEINKAHLNKKPFISACIVHGKEDVALHVVNLVDLKAIDRTVASNVPVYHDQTPLYLASARGMTQLVKALIAREVDLDAYSAESIISPSMYTALHAAAAKGHDEIVAALLQAGANPNKKALNNAYGKDHLPFIQNLAPLTPWQWAVDLHSPNHSNRKVIEAFKKFSTVALSRELPEMMGTPKRASDLWYGKFSLPLRLITEEARTQGQIQDLPTPLRCFCPNEAKIPAIRACIDRLHSRPSRIWTPVIHTLESFSEREQELGIFFLPRGDNSHSPHKSGVCGTYNNETGHIITIDADWVFEHYDPAAVLIHEATHKMAHRIFETHSCGPVKGVHGNHFHQNFYVAIQKDLALLSQTNWDGIPQQVAESLKDIVSGIVDHEKRPSEVIARLPEAAYLLSRFGFTEEEIHQQLEKLLPNTFPLYLSEFIPACEKLAQKNKMEMG